MELTKLHLALFLISSSAIGLPAQDEAAPQAANFVIKNAKIMTMDSRYPRAEALAARGEWLVAVGTGEQIEPLIGADTKVVDAGGYRLEGAAAVIDADRTFREQADRPQIIVDTLDHWGKGMLMRGHLESPMAEIDGPLMWRIEFSGNRIGLIETTRPLDRMTAPMFASRRSASAAR